MDTKHALVLYAHGARDPDWATPFLAVRELLRARLPDTPVELAFLEYMPPALSEVVAALDVRGVTAVTVVPLFWGRGRHLKEDLPHVIDTLRARHPQLPINLTDAAGDASPVHAAIASWIVSLLPESR